MSWEHADFFLKEKGFPSVNMAAKWGGTIKTYLAGIGGMTIAYGTIMQVAASQKRSKNKMVPDGVVLHLDMGVPIVETPYSMLLESYFCAPRDACSRSRGRVRGSTRRCVF